MSRALYIAALTGAVAAAPTAAQTRSPFQGATPDTLILDNGWQMTPQGDQCTLTHHPQGEGQDLLILAPRHDDGVVFGIILPVKGAYTKPVQLTVVVQGSEAQQIGRVTFNPTTGVLGTLLMAKWPADRLLPRLIHAERLNVYAPDQRLLRSVRLAGSVAAVEAVNRCRDAGTASVKGVESGIEPSAATATPEHRSIDVGWVPEFDRQTCSIKRMTAKGNELDVFYGRREGLLLVYRAINGPRPAPGSKVTAQLNLWRLAPSGAIVGEQASLPPVQMTMAARNQAPLLFGRVPTGLVDKLRDSHWNTIAFGTVSGGRGDVDDTAHTGGSTAALDAMAKCIRELAS